jgi:hypothetical protein
MYRFKQMCLIACEITLNQIEFFWKFQRNAMLIYLLPTVIFTSFYFPPFRSYWSAVRDTELARSLSPSIVAIGTLYMRPAGSTKIKSGSVNEITLITMEINSGIQRI